MLYKIAFPKNFSEFIYDLEAVSHPEVFCEKIFLKILQNSQINIFAGISFLLKLQTGNLKMSEAATRDVQ